MLRRILRFIKRFWRQIFGKSPKSLFLRGNEQYEAGNFEDAIASYNQALEIKPDEYLACERRGVADRKSVV